MTEPKLAKTEYGTRREEIEERLLVELKEAEAAFQTASPEQRDAAEARYRDALDRFNEVIVYRRIPPDICEEA